MAMVYPSTVIRLGAVEHHEDLKRVAAQPAERLMRSRRRSSSYAVFRAQASLLVGGSAKSCVVKVDGEKSQLEVMIPDRMETISFSLTSENFTVDVLAERRLGFEVHLFDADEMEVECLQFIFKDPYCLTRMLFTLFVLRTDVSFKGLCFLADACVNGSVDKASYNLGFCSSFFTLHARDLIFHFPQASPELMAMVKRS